MASSAMDINIIGGCLTSIEIPIIKIRQSHESYLYNGNPVHIPGKTVFILRESQYLCHFIAHDNILICVHIKYGVYYFLVLSTYTTTHISLNAHNIYMDCAILKYQHKANDCINIIIRDDSRFAPSQWETALLCNNVSHWMGTSLESALITEQWQMCSCWTTYLLQRCQVGKKKFREIWKLNMIL